MSRRDPGGRYPPPGGPVASLRTRVNGDYSTGSSSSSVARELDDLMRIIESDWMMLTRSNYSPVETAMQLMDRSSLGRDYNAFKSLYSRIERALQYIVNDHFQSFNNSIGLYRGLVLNLSLSQDRLRKLRDTLVSTKENITKKGGDLSITLHRSQQYKEMLKLLDTMERLQAVPDKIENLITEKHFTRAVQILSESLRILNQPEFITIAALQDIFAYLKNQEASLHDLLVEELHNHLYLKSPYCLERWTSYETGQTQLPRQENVSKYLNKLDISEGRSSLSGLALLEESPPNSGVHPESNSFEYIKQIVIALQSLSQLHRAMDTLTQRLPLEVYQLVDKTISEVESRHSVDLRVIKNLSSHKRFEALTKSEANADVLADLLWTLYSKLAAVLGGHRVVHDCVLGIVKESKTNASVVDSPEYNYIEVWKPIQSEIRSLLLDYLTNDVHGTAAVHSTVTSLNEMFTTRRGRDSSKILFRLDYDQQSSQSSQKNEEEELYKLLESSVPGLVLQREKSKSDASNIGTSRGMLDLTVTGHKLLVLPNPFNIVYLLPPTLAFLDRVKELIPASLASSTVTSFLDDFLVAVFLPQLEDTVSDAFSSITDDDAFQTVNRPV